MDMEVLDTFADGTPYQSLAASFLEFTRLTGNDPVLLVAEAAASTTGQNYVTGVQPTVERFREAFVETERCTSFVALTELDLEDEALLEAFGAQRKRHVFLEIADVLANRPENSDFDALQSWAAEADAYRYESDPVGSISGVGPSTFQYLRQLAGIDTAKPDPTLESLLEAVDEALQSSPIDTSEPLRMLASCEWLALESSYSMLEIDRIAWWTFADERERSAVTDATE